MTDAILEGFGDPIKEIDESEFEHKLKKISPFDYANSIYNKDNLMIDERTEKEYNPFIVNRAMGFGKDTCIAANEMNSRPHLDNKLQYDFLMDVVRKGKRYNKWLKSEEENIEAIQKFFGYSFIKAKETLNLLSDTQIDIIKVYLENSKGGKA